ncbi:unnamed protein product, partial [Prunus brigantina]
ANHYSQLRFPLNLPSYSLENKTCANAYSHQYCPQRPIDWSQTTPSVHVAGVVIRASPRLPPLLQKPTSDPANFGDYLQKPVFQHKSDWDVPDTSKESNILAKTHNESPPKLHPFQETEQKYHA